MERDFFKRMNAQKLQSSVQTPRQLQLLVKDGDHEVNAHRDPNLTFHRIGARAVVVLDAQVAFDPAEEQLDPPAQAIKLCRGQRRNAQVVAQEDEIPTVLFVE